MIRSWQGKTPLIHPDAFVSEAAYVVGDVEIGAGSSVWPGTVIRGDFGKIVIGRNTCIQDNSIVHSDGPATIGDNVVIGHRVLCHAIKVGDNAVLGNGAIVNGGLTEIGESCIIAAGAVLLEGARVPPNTIMMGVPAQARGEVTDEHRERFRWTADHYAGLARQYKAEGLEAKGP
jgi:carbonic anhydrase/acetyltransferase-like protein (isoleucine patch superfamily)